MDGIDVALIETDGEDAGSGPGGQTYPYEAAFRVALREAIAEARSLTDRSRPDAGSASTI